MAFKWTTRLLRWMSPTRKGIQEAADQRLGKSNKLQTFHELTMERDFQELAEEDRESVRQFRDQKMGITGSGKSAGDRDSWVCDDMTINAARSNLPELMFIAALLALGYWLFGREQSPSPSTEHTTVPVVVPDTEYDVLFYDKDGNPIHVPHISTRPK